MQKLVASVIAGQGHFNVSVVASTQSKESSSVGLSFDLPEITSIFGNKNVSVEGGTVLTLYGQNFGVAYSVR